MSCSLNYAAPFTKISLISVWLAMQDGGTVRSIISRIVCWLSFGFKARASFFFLGGFRFVFLHAREELPLVVSRQPCGKRRILQRSSAVLQFVNGMSSNGKWYVFYWRSDCGMLRIF